MAYHYKRKISVDNTREEKPENMKWVNSKERYSYMVRSDAGGLSTRTDHCNTLTEARKTARQRAAACGWGEIFRWAENGVSIRKFHVATYERELSA